MRILKSEAGVRMIILRESEGYPHEAILKYKCSEMARNTTKTYSLITNSNKFFWLLHYHRCSLKSQKVTQALNWKLNDEKI